MLRTRAAPTVIRGLCLVFYTTVLQNVHLHRSLIQKKNTPIRRAGQKRKPSPLRSRGHKSSVGASAFNPQVLTTATSSSYAPGAVGLEGYESSHQLLRCDPGLTGAFLRGINSHLRVPVGDLDTTLDALSHNLHASGGASNPHRPLSSRYWDIPPNLSPLLGPQALAPEGLGHGSWAVTPIDKQVRITHRLASNGLKYMLEASTIAQTVIPPGDEHVVPPSELRPMMGNLREALCATATTLGELVHPSLVQQRTATLKSSSMTDMERFLQEPYVPGSILGPSAQSLWKNGPDLHHENSRLLRQLTQPRQQQSRRRGRGARGPLQSL